MAKRQALDRGLAESSSLSLAWELWPQVSVYKNLSPNSLFSPLELLLQHKVTSFVLDSADLGPPRAFTLADASPLSSCLHLRA
jgi:hypothetical protein